VADASMDDAIQKETRAILEGCTLCGRCVEVCPIVPHTAASGTDPKLVIGGVLDLLRGNEGNAAAAAWVEACAGSGVCIKACPEPVNPRRMMELARYSKNRRTGGGNFAGYFKSMGETTKVVAGLQVDSEGMKRLTGRQDVRKERAQVVFWIGCNLPRTSHLVLTLEDIFTTLEVDCEVVGGLNNCCGIVHFWAGDSKTRMKIATNLKRNLDGFEPEVVLSWCPSCQVQYDEHLTRFLEFSYPVEHVSKYLVDHLELFEGKWAKRIEKRVAMHEHHGLEGAAQNIRKLVEAIPGITVVDVDQLADYGYMCSRLTYAPAAKAAAQKRILEAASAARVDVLVTPYHSCQRDLCVEERNYPFEVKNFVTLLGEALGIGEYEDKYKEFRLLGDSERIIQNARPFMEANRLDDESVRRVIDREFLKKP